MRSLTFSMKEALKYGDLRNVLLWWWYCYVHNCETRTIEDISVRCMETAGRKTLKSSNAPHQQRLALIFNTAISPILITTAVKILYFIITFLT